jgi:NAD(P)H-nitrite reductase large subunit
VLPLGNFWALLSSFLLHAESGHTSVACIGAATRAGTGCGGCKQRIDEVLERFSTLGPTP